MFPLLIILAWFSSGLLASCILYYLDKKYIERRGWTADMVETLLMVTVGGPIGLVIALTIILSDYNISQRIADKLNKSNKNEK